MMDVPTLMHNLKEEVTCSVCMQPYTKPKQLPCFHIFCLQCLNDLARTSSRNGKIKCPLCQIEVAVPETGTMETLPSCFYVKNLLDILAIKECNTSKVACGNCDAKSEEASYCFHCGGFWCNDCVNAHNILRANKEHRVLSLKDFRDEDFEDVLRRPAFCQKELHEKEVLKFYCKVCEVPVCQNCVIVEHNKHDVEYLEVCARAVKNSIASKLEMAKKSSQTFSSHIQELEISPKILEHRSQMTKEQIYETTKSLISTIKQQEQELVAKVENKTKALIENNMKNKAKFQEQLKKNEEKVKQAEHLLKCSTGAELLRTKTVIDELFQDLQEEQDMSSTTDWKSVTLFVKNEEITKCLQTLTIGQLDTRETTTEATHCSVKVLRAAEAGLEVEIEAITRNSEQQQHYCPWDYITADVLSAQGRKTEVKIVDKKNGCYAILFIPSEAGQCFLTIQINQENIKELPWIDIKQRSFRPVRIIGEETIEGANLKRLWGATVNDLNEIYVSDMSNHRIVVFNEKGEFIRAFGQNVLDCPNGLITDKTDRIFVSSRSNNKIFLFGSNGEYISTIYNGESLRAPRGISLDAQGNLIVCDAGNKCIRFISPEGNIFKTIGRGWLQMPFDCLCYQDKIFVSDHEAHLIKVYNSNGRFLYEFGRHGIGDGEINSPTGLAVDKTGHLLVCSDGNHSVQVFTLDGKFVTKFGVCGKELGQLKRPTSVCVLKSGRLVVCEFENFRLQFFD